MSRIILTKYDNGDQHVVVGWDRPLNTFFWQEFNREPDPDSESGEVNWDEHDGWEEMLGYAGYIPSEFPSINALVDDMPEQYRPLVNERVRRHLIRHARVEPDPGSIMVDLTKEVQG